MLTFGIPFFKNKKMGGLGLQLPDPFNWVPGEISIINYLNQTRKPSIVLIATLVGLAMAISIIIIRWIAIHIHLKQLAREYVVEKDECPKIFASMEKYSQKLEINAPKLILTHDRNTVPQANGIVNTSVILSPNLIEELPKESTDSIIAHELAHLKRKDNLSQWLAMALRDLMFFNPLSHLCYRLIIKNNERSANKLLIKKLNIKPSTLAKTIESFNNYLKKSQKAKFKLADTIGFLFNSSNKEITWLNKKGSNKTSTREKITFILLFLLLFWLEVVYMAIP